VKAQLRVIGGDGRVLDATPGEVPAGCIGAVVRSDGSEFYFAVPVSEEQGFIDGNLGGYGTFAEAVEALRSNHRSEWTREERRLHPGGW
jgi:hypothetical protein